MKKMPYLLSPSLACSLSLALAISAVPAQAESTPPPGLSPAEPVFCTGNRTVTLRGRSIEASGHAIEVTGNCELLIVDCHLVAGGAAIQASGNADIYIEGSTLDGARGAIRASGLATITYVNSTLRGRIVASGLAELIDGGGNEIERRDSEAAEIRQPRREPKRTGRRRSRDGVRIGGIEIGRGGVRVGGVVVDEHGVNVGGGAVVVDDRGVDVGGGAVVVGDDGYVRLGGDSVVTVSDDWRRNAPSAEEADRLRVELGAVVKDDHLDLALAGDVLFDFGRADLRATAVAQLAMVAQLIRHRAAGRIIVLGHTDSIGSEADNLELSQQRTLSVMRWLHQQESIPAELMVGRGLGESEPIAHNTLPDGSDDPEGRARNRRVEIRMATH